MYRHLAVFMVETSYFIPILSYMLNPAPGEFIHLSVTVFD